MARPSLYTEELANEICDRIMLGETVRQICTDEHMPSVRTIYQWLEDQAGFSHNYARAREESSHNDADGVKDVARKVENGELAPDAGRVVIDALKWSAGKRKPKVYGDKHIHDIGDETLSKLTDAQLDARLAQYLRKAGLSSASGGEEQTQAAEKD